MKLIKLRIESFKCVENSEDFIVDDVTCLVGKNEAGKSAILQALYKLNPIEQQDSIFIETEFPRRHVTASRENGALATQNVVTSSWILTESDKIKMTELFGANPVKGEITIKKGYSNVLNWDFDIDECVLIKYCLDQFEFYEDQQKNLANNKKIADLKQHLSGVQGPTDSESKLIELLNKRFPQGATSAVQTALNDMLPKFLYFRDYDKLPGTISITDLIAKKANKTLSFGHKIFIALLDLANSTPENINTINTSEKLFMELEGISNKLTDEIFEYWSQNKHLNVVFKFDAARTADPPPFNQGFVFSTRILNTRHRATVNFDERSTGFIWFFSFLIWFSQIRRNYGENIFILLDEPGLSLHGRAQTDFLRYLDERLRPYHQVIYTTHSPFMIDPTHIFSVRTVEDVVKKDGDKEIIKGTKVGQRILSRDRDTLFPLQGILGFDIAQSMFLGPYVFVVEGPCEAGYINWFSRRLLKIGRQGLDLRWAVCPAEGASKISSFVTLFSGRGLEIAVLMDFHDSQKNLVKELEKSGLLKSGYLLKTNEFVAQKEADIEDLLGWDLYSYLVNKYLHLVDEISLPKKQQDGTERIVKSVESHCRTLPIGYPEFDHYGPVNALMNLDDEEIKTIEPILKEPLTRFEKLFTKLNSFIGTHRDGGKFSSKD